ncbi:DUF5753 domain-containing protein [Embleya scabrispora]|uniref:DUF5753 domain-containing protein n=1 Tax=Embleya scabrispora TaxID=159449 RepID=UPI001F302C32|nr:DUF5753 domain-containing protein [Embleya scabrispora]
MSARPLGANAKLVSARRALGLHSQAGFADAFEEHARTMGMRLAVSVRQVRRWESADPPYPTPDYERVLEDLFGRPLSALGFAALDGMPDGQSSHAWPGLITDGAERLRRLTQLEQGSASFRSYETTFIPGRLQTAEYALAVILMLDPTLSVAEAGERQQLRMDRAQRLFREGRPAWFIIAENALYNPFGSPEILANQLDHLVRVVSENPHIRVQILPHGAGFVAPAPCLIVEPKRGRYAAWLEQFVGSLVVDKPDDVERLGTTFDRLHTSALSQMASHATITSWRQELRRSIEFSASLVGSSPITPEMTVAAKLRSSALPWASGTPNFRNPQ